MMDTVCLIGPLQSTVPLLVFPGTRPLESGLAGLTSICLVSCVIRSWVRTPEALRASSPVFQPVHSSIVFDHAVTVSHQASLLYSYLFLFVTEDTITLGPSHSHIPVPVLEAHQRCRHRVTLLNCFLCGCESIILLCLVACHSFVKKAFPF